MVMSALDLQVSEQYFIRPIQQQDNISMGTLIRAVLKEYGADRPGTAFEDKELDNLCAAFASSNSAYFVIENITDKSIVGGCGVGPLLGDDGQICELKKMYLLPDKRGLGLARRLLESCLNFAKQTGYQQCYLETLANMTNAINMYQHFGFERLDAPLGDTGHHSCDVWMVKRL